jgi:hypothetical protein
VRKLNRFCLSLAATLLFPEIVIASSDMSKFLEIGFDVVTNNTGEENEFEIMHGILPEILIIAKSCDNINSFCSYEIFARNNTSDLVPITVFQSDADFNVELFSNTQNDELQGCNAIVKSQGIEFTTYQTKISISSRTIVWRDPGCVGGEGSFLYTSSKGWVISQRNIVVDREDKNYDFPWELLDQIDGGADD